MMAASMPSMPFTFPLEQQMLSVSQSQIRRAKARVFPPAEMFSIVPDTLLLLPARLEVCWDMRVLSGHLSFV